MSMFEQLKKIGRYLVSYKDPYAPDKQRRAQVIQQLSQRPSLSNEEWHRRFHATWGDADWDIFEEYSGEFGCNWPKCEGMKTIATFGDVKTFGKFLETLWAHA